MLALQNLLNETLPERPMFMPIPVFAFVVDQSVSINFSNVGWGSLYLGCDFGPARFTGVRTQSGESLRLGLGGGSVGAENAVLIAGGSSGSTGCRGVSGTGLRPSPHAGGAETDGGNGEMGSQKSKGKKQMQTPTNLNLGINWTPRPWTAVFRLNLDSVNLMRLTGSQGAGAMEFAQSSPAEFKTRLPLRTASR